MMVPPQIHENYGYDTWGNCGELLAPKDAKVLEDNTWFRAAGLCICPDCGYDYYKHPKVQGCLWLHRVCNGDLVKL